MNHVKEFSFTLGFNRLKNLSEASPFSIFNLSPKDVEGFYNKRSTIGVWFDGSPLIHQGKFRMRKDGVTSYNGECFGPREDLRSKYILFDGLSLNSLGEQMISSVLQLSPSLPISASPNPTVFSLSKDGTLPLHRDFDTGFRAIVNLHPSQVAYLDFERDRLRLEPGAIQIFSTNQWHGLNVHEPKIDQMVFTICLSAPEVQT